jgi:ribosome biogenesis GTPase
MVRIEGDRGTIEEVLPRRNGLGRPTKNDPDVVQITAANVDQLVVVVATLEPPLRTGLIDRYQVAAERQGMDLLLVVNKCDRGGRDEAEARVRVYADMSYPVLFTSAKTGEGVAALAERLRDKTSLLVGHSGVGKSSLVNAIEPGLGLRVGDVARHGRGRHTTTSVALWRLSGGGYLVDSPGVRGFGLFDVPPAELALLMPDLRPFATGCKYPDCTHDHEPICGVRAAVERGDVRRERYDSYVRMLKGILGEEDQDEDDA